MPEEFGRGENVNPFDWDHAIQERGGSLPQSWRWGEYKRRHGWQVERIHTTGPQGTGMAQVLFKPIGLFSVAYVLHGPVIEEEGRAVVSQLVGALDEMCREYRAISLVLEPARPLSLTGTSKSIGFLRGPRHLEMVQTVKMPLGDDDMLLAQMRKKTRQHVRRAQREGVTVDRPENAASHDVFYRLMQKTARRGGFPVHPLDDYTDVFRLFGDDAALLVARIDGIAAATPIAGRFGDEAVSLFLGSSTRHRVDGLVPWLELDTMRWGRERGCTRYDMWGIPTGGLQQFKSGFGGEVVSYPPTLERRYRPLLATLAPRAIAARTAVRSWLARNLAVGDLAFSAHPPPPRDPGREDPNPSKGMLMGSAGTIEGGRPDNSPGNGGAESRLTT